MAMKMVGYKTEAIYRRYAIVDEMTLRGGCRKTWPEQKHVIALGESRQTHQN